MILDNYFEKYPELLIGFRVNQNIKIIDFWYKDNWELLEPSPGVQYKKNKDYPDQKKAYYTIHSLERTFGQLFDELSRTIEYNLENERKQELFRIKMEEMKNLFTTLPLEELQNLQLDKLINKTPEPAPAPTGYEEQMGS